MLRVLCYFCYTNKQNPIINCNGFQPVAKQEEAATLERGGLSLFLVVKLMGYEPAVAEYKAE
ncbi:hypothetical protein BH09BAC1_BH09BAC1_21510 [soil metagenome]